MQGPADHEFKELLRTALELEQQSMGMFHNNGFPLMSDHHDRDFADYVGPVTFASHPGTVWGSPVVMIASHKSPVTRRCRIKEGTHP